MPVNTRRQTAGISPLIKVSKKNRKKTVPEKLSDMIMESQIYTDAFTQLPLLWILIDSISILILVCHNKFFVCVIT